jgi:hypothetical protein
MTNAYNPGSRFRLSSAYGKRIDPMTGIPGTFHSGQDFAAPAGTPIPSAASGKVVYSGYNTNLGNVVIIKNDTGGYSLYGHMQDGDRAELGRRIWQGDTIGLVGNTGARTKGNHLHYSVISKEAGDENRTFPGNGGGIGVSLNDKTTVNPADYDNYDPTPRYLDETRRAAQIMSGTDASATPGGLPPDRQDWPADRFGKWGSASPGVAQPPAPDRPESFDNRFGNWGFAPAGGFGNPGSGTPQSYKRSAAPDGLAPTEQGVLAATPASQPYVAGTGGVLGKFLDSLIMPAAATSLSAKGAPLPTPYFPGRDSNFGDQPGNAPGLPTAATPQRRVSSAFPGMTLPDSEPMPSLTPPPPGGLLNNFNASGNGDGFNFPTGLLFRNPAPPEPPPQTANSIPVRRLGRST